MTRVPSQLRRFVRDRARGHCEYCLIHEDDVLFPHEPDHIIAEKHQGPTIVENLAWACGVCNLNKGSDIASIDPLTGKVVPLFHPRKQQWRRNFRLIAATIEPLTASGRATAVLLQFNNPANVADRFRLIEIGRYPDH